VIENFAGKQGIMARKLFEFKSECDGNCCAMEGNMALFSPRKYVLI
jgi:hypothetical protein